MCINMCLAKATAKGSLKVRINILEIKTDILRAEVDELRKTVLPSDVQEFNRSEADEFDNTHGYK